ncbi:hypothetical protein BRE01_67850 [Brevibacillus reuszeri]|uniref:Uncharacterized protein n=1 Tax=Brevibacillus reuszeri TaxID=54915 RepID=A0A0K9YWF6_9BACL|nr:hypothetical protein ADS79_09495 [Brevibacillus reuszeri]GED73083.1 hypothetical protein BRE01_67850 [Brevibacillus reuszeri]
MQTLEKPPADLRKPQGVHFYASKDINLSTKPGNIDNQVPLEKATNTTTIVSKELHGYVGEAQSESASLNISTQADEICSKIKCHHRPRPGIVSNHF